MKNVQIQLYSNEELLGIRKDIEICCDYFIKIKDERAFIRFSRILGAIEREIKKRGVKIG